MDPCLQPCDLNFISIIKKRHKRWYNHEILKEKEHSHGYIVLKFGQFQFELESSIGLSAWKKSGLIELYDNQDDDVDVIIDDDDTPSSSQIMSNELSDLDLNSSQSNISLSSGPKNLKQTSISSYFCK